ncbi:MAG TPA: trypsin-like peptidase domain-containing protein [Terriglobales bacterium]|nr:trypsin-like peptidase domain-containing protein [Terriglobales bacterium]
MALSGSKYWAALSNETAELVEYVAGSVVAVHGGRWLAASGVHWRPGVVVTANHLLRRDEDLKVTLPDGSSVPGILAGRDPSTDIAAVKIEGAKLPVVERAGLEGLKVGHFVLAVGRSTRGEVAASAGIVARLGGPWKTWRGGQIDHLLRPDVRLYLGQAGSALVNGDGKVLGINTPALARRATITVPAATVDRVLDELLKRGYIARPYLGVAMQPVPLPEDVWTKLKLDSHTGLLVMHAEADSPASKARLMLGDVIVALQGKPVGDVGEMLERLGELHSGESAKVSIVRGGEKVEVSVTVGERPRRR